MTKTNDTRMIILETYSNPECALVDGASNSRNRLSGQRARGALLHPLSADLQLGLAEVGDHPLATKHSDVF